MILELKEKVDAAETAAASAGGAANTAQDNGMRAEAVAALVALGYDGASAGRGGGIRPGCDRVEDMIMRHCVQRLNKFFTPKRKIHRKNGSAAEHKKI